MVVALPGGCQKAWRGPGTVASAALGQAVQPAFDALQRATVRQRDEERVVARDRAGDLGPARPVERGGDGVGRPRQRSQDEQQPGLVDLERQVGQQLA